MDTIDALMKKFSEPGRNKIALIDEIRAECDGDRMARFLLPTVTDNSENHRVRRAALNTLRYCFLQDPEVMREVVDRMVRFSQDKTIDPELRVIALEVLMYNPKPDNMLELVSNMVMDRGENIWVRRAALQALSEVPNASSTLPKLRQIPQGDPLAAEVQEFIEKHETP
jgi:hypothetical protein